MGIETYVSRVALPGAAPSQRLRVVRRARPATVAPAPVAAPQGSPAAAAGLKAHLGQSSGRSARREVVSDTADTRPAPGADIPVFSVAAVSAGGWYWLDQLPPGRDPGPHYMQLIASICSALGLEAADPQLERFSWPMHNSSQIARDQGAAQEAFTAFLEGRLERLQPAGLVLLGELDDGLFDRGRLGDLPVVSTVSAWRMLRDPTLKPRAWQDLQSLRVNGG